MLVPHARDRLASSPDCGASTLPADVQQQAESHDGLPVTQQERPCVTRDQAPRPAQDVPGLSVGGLLTSRKVPEKDPRDDEKASRQTTPRAPAGALPCFPNIPDGESDNPRY